MTKNIITGIALVAVQYYIWIMKEISYNHVFDVRYVMNSQDRKYLILIHVKVKNMHKSYYDAVVNVLYVAGKMVRKNLKFNYGALIRLGLRMT
jgi:hypothetical protein